MKKYKWLIIAAVFAAVVPLIFWWGASHGNHIDSMLFLHGTELIRLQKDIKRLQVHIAELSVENHRLKSNIHKIYIFQETIKIHLPQ